MRIGLSDRLARQFRAIGPVGERSAKGSDGVSAIVVEGLSKHYGQVRAVDDVSFSVETGEVFGLLGPNGAGKTTTVEILVGLRQRDKGKASVLGLDPGRDAAALKTRIGVQLQTVALYPRLTVSETADLFASFYPRPLDAARLLARVGLKDKMGVQTMQLSGGQRQRLAIALAMIGDGELAFLDEPTTGLDPQARRSLWDLILDLKGRGKTVFLTTHYMDEAERLCDRVAVMDHGRIIALDSPRQLINHNFAERAVEFQSEALAKDEELTKLPGVSRVHANGDNVVTLYTTDAGRTIDELMHYSAKLNSPVEGLVVRQATLEDVFLKLTGRRIRE